MNKVIRCGIISGLAEEESRLERLRKENNIQITELKIRGKHLSEELTSVRCMLEHLSNTGDEI